MRITTDQDYTKFSGPQLDAFVNLGDPCELSFYKKDEISDLIPEVTDSTELPADDDPARMPDDDKVFTTDVLQDNIFTLYLDYNELVIYDPTIMVFQGDMTKYQSFLLLDRHDLSCYHNGVQMRLMILRTGSTEFSFAYGIARNYFCK